MNLKKLNQEWNPVLKRVCCDYFLLISFSICRYGEISICHYGGRPRFLAAPPLTLNLPLMASKETLEQVKNLLKQELSPINAKL